MLAVVQSAFGGIDTLEVKEISAPTRGAGQLLLRVKAAGVNRADLAQRAGHYLPPPGVTTILGLEASGVVVEADTDSSFKPGDAVFGLVSGGYAECALLDEELAIAKPDWLSWEEAASLPEAWMTAWFNLVEKACLQAGETVLVHAGASGVGAAAIQLAGLLDARVFASAGSEAKLAFCRKLGATQVFNYQDTPAFGALVKSWGGVDVVLDLVGGQYLNDNLLALQPDGRLVNIGLVGGRQAELNLAMLLMKRLVVIGSTLRPQPMEVKERLTRALEARILPALEQGKLHLTLDSTYPLMQVADAHGYLEARRNSGKVVLNLSPALST